MRPLRRAARIAGWTAAGVVYVWFSAVRNAEVVKARKAARRAARRTGSSLRS